MPLWSFVNLCMCGEKSELLNVHIPKVIQGHELPSHFSSHTLNKCPFCRLFTVIFFLHFCTFIVISLFEMAPKHSAELWSSVLKHKKTVMCLVCQMSFTQAGVTLLLALSSILVNQQYILSKVSLNRNIHKTRLYIDWLMKM